MPWQPAAVVYPDIELLLTQRLRVALADRAEPYAAGVYVSNSIPNPRRDRMVVVRRDGGTQAEMRDRPRVSLRVWATTKEDAADLARLVVALCRWLPDGDPIVAVPDVGISGPYAIPDESGQPLQYAVIEVHTRGVQI